MSILRKPEPVTQPPALPVYSVENPAPGSVLGRARHAYADAIAEKQACKDMIHARQAESGKVPQPGPGMTVAELAAAKIWREAAKDSVIYAESALKEAELHLFNSENALHSIERQVQMFWAERAKLPDLAHCDPDQSVSYRFLTDKICSLIL